MPDRSYLSIGDVLSLLKEEFPDVTISKIRFLESQGLIDPERTPSGYRKFYEEDVGRLRWILQQQREHFLPLRVIKDRLEDDVELSGGSAPVSVSLSSGGGLATAVVDAPSIIRTGDSEVSEDPDTSVVLDSAESVESAEPEIHLEPTPPSGATAAAVRARLALSVEAGSFTKEELAEAAGLSEAAIDDLERFGLVQGQAVLGSTFYRQIDLEIATISAGFLRLGLEARHIRAYRSSAEREASLFEQVVLPLLRQRNPRARTQAAEMLDELGQLGGDLRQALLRAALGEMR